MASGDIKIAVLITFDCYKNFAIYTYETRVSENVDYMKKYRGFKIIRYII